MTENAAGGEDGQGFRVTESETADCPFRGRVKVYQPAKGFRYSVDAFILVDFVNRLISGNKPDSINAAELGSGTGIVSLGLALIPAIKHVTGIEIVAELAELSRNSVKDNCLDDKVKIITGDFKDSVAAGMKYDSCDLVVSNPPYRPVGEGRVSPDFARAVARHEVAANLDDLVQCAARLLKSSGTLCLIYIPERLVELLLKLQEAKIEPRRLRFLHPRHGATARMVLVEARKGAARGLEVDPPIYVHDEQGRYTPELEAMFDGPK